MLDQLVAAGESFFEIVNVCAVGGRLYVLLKRVQDGSFTSCSDLRKWVSSAGTFPTTSRLFPEYALPPGVNTQTCTARRSTPNLRLDAEERNRRFALGKRAHMALIGGLGVEGLIGLNDLDSPAFAVAKWPLREEFGTFVELQTMLGGKKWDDE